MQSFERGAQGCEQAMNYDIWDVGTGNCIGRYGTAAAALARVRDLIDQFGAAYARDLEVAAEDDLGNFVERLSGADLQARAEAVPTAR